MQMSQLQQIVTKARYDIEHGLIDERLLTQLYHVYNPKVVAGRFVAEAKKTFPAGNCGLATTYLYYLLDRGVVHRGSYDGVSHTFLLLDTGWIADITADQFVDGPAVYVGPLQQPWAL